MSTSSLVKFQLLLASAGIVFFSSVNLLMLLPIPSSHQESISCCFCQHHFLIKCHSPAVSANIVFSCQSPAASANIIFPSSVSLLLLLQALSSRQMSFSCCFCQHRLRVKSQYPAAPANIMFLPSVSPAAPANIMFLPSVSPAASASIIYSLSFNKRIVSMF
ncbi:hypothetical protein PoB_005261300 [Plakobranchus ocellatus]|uniref:Uncharacterized protein n=1 Tax=Plakobranchus ocellatus TaxID=259542 RepID=A0AAV4C2H7_9GAST|nr:hypothetical protein PoB_005261300 [Plakobranchus ocellatus]